MYHKKTGVRQEFSLYRYYDEETYLDYHLIANRCEDGFLLEELKNIDYFLRISGDCEDDFTERLLVKLLKISRSLVFLSTPSTVSMCLAALLSSSG